MAPEDKVLRVDGLVQGLVIGDNNTVNQNFNVTRHEAYVAQEYRPVPPYWIDRPALVTQCISKLKPGSVIALLGMGGSGKTSLAGRVAAEVSSRFPDGCFWIDLAADDTDQALARIALAFGHDISLLKSRDARANMVRSLMVGRSVLLVLDDAWATSDLTAFLPLPSSCAALLTTRNDSLAASATTEIMVVEELTAEDAIALLASVSGSPVTEPFLRSVADSLGGLPLALELAGKLARQQARRPGFSWATFAASFVGSTERLSLGLAGTTVRAAFDATWTRAMDKEVQRAFALLGLFEAGEISTAETAAAWNADERMTLAYLNQLIDLSLVRPVDTVTFRLHPLLADYAREMAGQVPSEERTSAHCRVADYLFRIAPHPPRNLSDITIVLRSHFHATKASDSKRAQRVYPSFFDGNEHTAVAAFLIDHGQYRTKVMHDRLELDLSKNRSAWSRSFSIFRLGQALQMAGELTEAEKLLLEAVALMDSPEVDDDGRAIGLSKFLMTLGQVQSQLGKLDAAEAALRRAVDFDRKVAAKGEVMGASNGALIGLLQLADLLEQSDRPQGSSQAETICHDVYAEASQHSMANIAIMALARLACMFEQADRAKALEIVRTAQHVSKNHPDAFSGRQGARYARLLAQSAATLAINGEPALDDALDLLCAAIANAGRCDAQQELGYSLYELGNLFEHYHLIGRNPPLAAACACYSLSDAYTKESDSNRPNAQIRIKERIITHMEEAQRITAVAAVAANPWGLIDEALAPRVLAWHPES